MKTTYFKIKKEKQEYHGVRYFKHIDYCDKVVQVCIFNGDVKKGKSNTFGVYLIARLTFLTNYLAMGYAVICTKREYDKNFDKAFKMLK